jgi:hypothetical protein
MDVRGQHHVVELLAEYGRREERDRPQGLFAGIGEVVAHRGREGETLPGPTLCLLATGVRPLGFNAFWMRQTPRALSILQELGFLYRRRLPAQRRHRAGRSSKRTFRLRHDAAAGCAASRSRKLVPAQWER